jgi:hypothetical protein
MALREASLAGFAAINALRLTAQLSRLSEVNMPMGVDVSSLPAS